MGEENNWKEFSDDVSDISKNQIKFADEENIED